MVELCLMASHGCPPGLGVALQQEQASSRATEGFHPFSSSHVSKQELITSSRSLNSSFLQKTELRSAVDCWMVIYTLGLIQQLRDPPSLNFKIAGSGKLAIELCVIFYPFQDSIEQLLNSLILMSETHRDSVHFSMGIAERCTRHEKILKISIWII